MSSSRIRTVALVGLALLMVSGCARVERQAQQQAEDGVFVPDAEPGPDIREPRRGTADNGSIFDIFRGGGEQDVKVNRHLWTAALEVLNFLPIEAADPFTGVITTGYGTPPGGGRAYRATILISDPALDARSLNVALQTRSGPVAAGTQRAVEDAILDRARQLRINSRRF